MFLTRHGGSYPGITLIHPESIAAPSGGREQPAGHPQRLGLRKALNTSPLID
jgi:hypothetical protein